MFQQTEKSGLLLTLPVWAVVRPTISWSWKTDQKQNFIHIKASVQILDKGSHQFSLRSHYFIPVCSNLEEHLLPAEPY